MNEIPTTVWFIFGAVVLLLLGLTYLVITHKIDLGQLSKQLHIGNSTELAKLQGQLDTIISQNHMIHAAVQMPLQVVTTTQGVPSIPPAPGLPTSAIPPIPLGPDFTVKFDRSVPFSLDGFHAFVSAAIAQYGYGIKIVDQNGVPLDSAGRPIEQSKVTPVDETTLTLDAPGRHPLVILPKPGDSKDYPFTPNWDGPVQVTTIGDTDEPSGDKIGLMVLSADGRTLASEVGDYHCAATAIFTASKGASYIARVFNRDVMQTACHVQYN